MQSLRLNTTLLASICALGSILGNEARSEDKGSPALTDRCVLTISKVEGKTEEVLGDIEIGVYGNDVPKTAKNFMELCGKSKKAEDNKYSNSVVHRVIPGFMMQAGDFENNNGTGGASIYGKKFADENFKYKHTKAGLVSMANSGPNSNGSQFFITFKETPWLDGKHVIFGEVVGGMDVVKKVENYGSDRGDTVDPKTKNPVVIKIKASSPVISADEKETPKKEAPKKAEKAKK